MGAPKRNRRTFEKPKDIWNLQRISTDNAIIKEFGLKNMSELWKVQSELSRVRRNARELLTGGVGAAEKEQAIIGRLSKYGIVQRGSTLSNLLDLKESSFLERRLQTVVFRKGLARSMKQARQLIVHGYISVNGKRVNRPGILVPTEQEGSIGYYKPIDITPKTPPPKEGEGAEGVAAEAKQEAEAKAAEVAAATS
ncbi:MAG: 30S ribosomal protein S4 [Candidatus Micrarchaeota archaeon]|nr:30S ribosomal protein S4 [Candidatus Micrarchaeota archaeon]